MKRVEGHLSNGFDGFQALSDPPSGCRSALRRLDSTGDCWFHDTEAHACALHRQFGEDLLPSACRHFPRVCVLEPEQVSLSLSHYCPTAVATLFRESGGFDLVENPWAFPREWPFEGLDARNAYPPFLRPGVLLGADGLRSFEEGAVAALAGGNVWTAMQRIEGVVEAVRSWTPARGALSDLVRTCFAHGASGPEGVPATSDPASILLRSLTSGTPEDPVLPAYVEADPQRTSIADLALRRYLAARLIAGWVVFLADDLRTVGKYLRLCLDTVLRFEAARSADESPIERWREAIRSADLWLLHYCDPELLARNLR